MNRSRRQLRQRTRLIRQTRRTRERITRHGIMNISMGILMRCKPSFISLNTMINNLKIVIEETFYDEDMTNLEKNQLYNNYVHDLTRDFTSIRNHPIVLYVLNHINENANVSITSINEIFESVVIIYKFGLTLVETSNIRNRRSSLQQSSVETYINNLQSFHPDQQANLLREFRYEKIYKLVNDNLRLIESYIGSLTN